MVVFLCLYIIKDYGFKVVVGAVKFAPLVIVWIKKVKDIRQKNKGCYNKDNNLYYLHRNINKEL